MWTQIYLEYANGADAIKCPKCEAQLTVEETRRSVTFSCKACGAYRHIVKIVNEQPEDENSGLK